MNLNDIITLAKQGYKPNDIKELIAMAEKSEDIPENQGEVKPEESTESESTTPEEKPTETVEPEVDYKKLYEESQENLKKAQKANVKENLQTEVFTDEESFNELARAFM